MKIRPLVSVVIPTKNEEKNISRCLQSLKNQDYPQERIEIIVVDNPTSTDRTKEISRQYTNKVFTYGQERSAQRNFGMLKKAKGKYLFYLDADMSLSRNVIKEAVLKAEKENLVALYLPEVIPGSSFWAKVRNLERSFYDGTMIDAPRFLERKAFKKVNGFDEDLFACEDWDLDKRVRKEGKIGLLARDLGAVIYHHEPDFNLKNYLAKKGYYQKNFSQYFKKWGTKETQLQFDFCYRYFGIFLEKGKWKRFLSHPFLVLGIYVLRIGVGFTYLPALIKKWQQRIRK